MVESVINDSEVYLGRTRFPLAGKVQPRLLSRFPEKVVFGDYSYDNEQFLSNLIISDLRGGIGVENADESNQLNRSWFAACNTSCKNHIVLSPLATQTALEDFTGSFQDGGFEDWVDGSNLTHWSFSPGIGGSLSRQGSSDDYYARISIAPYCTGANLGQTIVTGDDIANYRGKTFSVKADIRTSEVPTYGYGRIYISDGVGTTYSTSITGADWSSVTITRTIDANATSITIGCEGYWSYTGTKYFDFNNIRWDGPKVGTDRGARFANFNDDLYLATDNILWKLNGDGDGFTFLKSFYYNIADLCADDNLYLCFGRSDAAYCYMNTDEHFVQTGNSGGGTGDVYAKYFVACDDKLFAIDETGQMAYSTSPAAGNPVWTNIARIKQNGDKVNSLFTYRDAGGDIIVYAATRSRLWALDFDNSRFVGTELKYPDHINAGKGAVHWREALYTSIGLEVRKYVTGSTALLSEVGLNNDDGLPPEFNGEITGLIEGNDAVFALLDSSQVSGESVSALLSYNGSGWQCLWTAPTSNGKMNSGIVSNTVAYRLWFDHGGTIYYLPLSRGLRNRQISSEVDYAAGGYLVTSWFDAGTAAYDKLATKMRLFCRRMSATETITVKYRLDYGGDDIGSGWRELGIVDTDGETEFIFGNTSEGRIFRTIQFRFDLQRGEATACSPDIQGITFSYLKLLGLTWGWSFVINCGCEYCGRSPRELEAALLEAANSSTLLEFTYRADVTGAETHYVKVHPLQGIAPTGDNYEGQYEVTLIAP